MHMDIIKVHVNEGYMIVLLCWEPAQSCLFHAQIHTSMFHNFWLIVEYSFNTTL